MARVSLQRAPRRGPSLGQVVQWIQQLQVHGGDHHWVKWCSGYSSFRSTEGTTTGSSGAVDTAAPRRGPPLGQVVQWIQQLQLHGGDHHWVKWCSGYSSFRSTEGTTTGSSGAVDTAASGPRRGPPLGQVVQWIQQLQVHGGDHHWVKWCSGYSSFTEGTTTGSSGAVDTAASGPRRGPPLGQVVQWIQQLHGGDHHWVKWCSGYSSFRSTEGTTTGSSGAVDTAASGPRRGPPLGQVVQWIQQLQVHGGDHHWVKWCSGYSRSTEGTTTGSSGAVDTAASGPRRGPPLGQVVQWIQQLQVHGGDHHWAKWCSGYSSFRSTEGTTTGSSGAVDTAASGPRRGPPLGQVVQWIQQLHGGDHHWVKWCSGYSSFRSTEGTTTGSSGAVDTAASRRGPPLGQVVQWIQQLQVHGGDHHWVKWCSGYSSFTEGTTTESSGAVDTAGPRRGPPLGQVVQWIQQLQVHGGDHHWVKWCSGYSSFRSTEGTTTGSSGAVDTAASCPLRGPPLGQVVQWIQQLQVHGGDHHRVKWCSGYSSFMSTEGTTTGSSGAVDTAASGPRRGPPLGQVVQWIQQLHGGDHHWVKWCSGYSSFTEGTTTGSSGAVDTAASGPRRGPPLGQVVQWIQQLQVHGGDHHWVKWCSGYSSFTEGTTTGSSGAVDTAASGPRRGPPLGSGAVDTAASGPRRGPPLGQVVQWIQQLQVHGGDHHWVKWCSGYSSFRSTEGTTTGSSGAVDTAASGCYFIFEFYFYS